MQLGFYLSTISFKRHLTFVADVWICGREKEKMKEEWVFLPFPKKEEDEENNEQA